MQIEIPEELANQLKPMSDRIPQILELGLRKFNEIGRTDFEGAGDVLEFLATLPDPEDIIKLCPSEKLQKRISQLLEKNRNEGLSPEEETEWEHFQYLEHLVRMAKTKAHMKLKRDH